MQEGQEPTRFTMPAGLAELKAELEHHWPVMQAALRATGVPLNDDEETDEEREAREAAEVAAAAKKKPWGDDKDFDPDKAWKLIENLRGDVDKAKKRGDDLAEKVKGFEDATKSDSQKLEDRATTAESTAAAASREAARLRIAIKKGLTEIQAKRLVGDTEEELEADADELLKSFTDDENNGGEGEGGNGRTTPKPRLRTGAAPSSEPEETDPDKLAAQVPRR